ncbi:MAG: LamG domain-containing protein, partial [Phycisphaerae bacterium]|nr:LamG domain-containing protein [Phycisphaerae bacterium]
MFRKLIYLLSFVLLLGLTPMASADLIGWWTLDEGTGTVAHDSSGNNNNGTFVSTPQWVAGQLGGGLQFNGSSSVDCGSSTTLQVTGPITVACWVNPAVLGGERGFFGRDADYAFKASGTTLRFTTPGILDHTATNATLKTGTWQHAAATFNPGQANGLIFYLNGVQTDRLTASSMNAGTGPFRIGSNQWSEFYTGLIDDVQVYNEILPIDGINKIMKGLANKALAVNVSPADGATDVPRDATLNWTAGQYPATHDVYFGTVAADVNNASRTNKGLLVSQGQADTSFDPAGVFAYGQTYYWRIDEVNKSADGTIFKGGIWSFTAEPYGYP